MPVALANQWTISNEQNLMQQTENKRIELSHSLTIRNITTSKIVIAYATFSIFL